MKRPQIIGLASAGLLLLIGFLVVLFLLWRSKHREDDLEHGPSSAQVAAVQEEPEPRSETDKGETRLFGWAEVESLTGNFSSEAVIGEGGFSTVYLARLPDSSLAAVKVHRATASERLHRAFRQELDLLLRLSHPNIVRLLGYCDEREEGVLVFEYIHSGSLHDRLHSAKQVLPWGRRTSIAYQLAQALEFLHEGCDPQVVHGDVKAANVLLDGRLDPKLCDFGSACVGFSAAVQPPSRSTRPLMMGSPGYVDPHYLRTGVASKKSDVYSFGVLLLELLTGAEAFCSEREQPLMALLGPMLPTEGEKEVVGELVDPRLAVDYDAGEAVAMASLAARCVGEQPSLRPSMTEVVRIMAEKMSSALIPSVDAKSSGKV